MDYFQMVEDAWNISDSIRQYIMKSGRAVEPSEVWDNVLSQSPLVDKEATLRSGEFPPSKIILKSPYGLYYKPETRDWIPFRHANGPSPN